MKRRDALKHTGLILGYSLSAGTVAAVINGCTAPTSEDWMPSTLDSKTIEIIAEIGETILPATDTPGAKDVLVHRFVDVALSHFYGPNQKAHLLAGINGFDAACIDKMGASFLDLDADKRMTFVLYLEEVSDKATNEFMAKAEKNKKGKADEEPPRAGPMSTPEPTEFSHYYKDLKELILAGYFTSEKIGKEVLAYDPVPQDYYPCIPMTPETKAWTL